MTSEQLNIDLDEAIEMEGERSLVIIICMGVEPEGWGRMERELVVLGISLTVFDIYIFNRIMNMYNFVFCVFVLF